MNYDENIFNPRQKQIARDMKSSHLKNTNLSDPISLSL